MRSMSEAMKEAGVDTNGARLYQIAVTHLKIMSPRHALARFVEEVRADGGILAALITQEQTEGYAIAYLSRVERDMKRVSAQAEGEAGVSLLQSQTNGASPKFPAKAGDGPKFLLPAGQTRNDPSNFGDDAGLYADAINGRARHAPSSPSQSHERAALEAPARAVELLPYHGLPRRTLESARRIASVSTTIFDSYKLRDGTPIGELRYSQLDRYIGANAREAAVLRMIRNHGEPADANLKISDFITVETLQRFVQKAAEQTHAA